MQKYRRVALRDRYQIQVYLASGIGMSQAARELGFAKSTVYREQRRNQVAKMYEATAAQALARERFSRCKRRLKITGRLKKFILRKLRGGWSPDQIARRLREEKSCFQISYQTIYRLVKRLGIRRTHLHLGYKRRGFGRGLQRAWSRKSSWKNSIHERPPKANLRMEIGHWERDLFFTKNRKTVMVLTDRKSRYTLLARNPNFKSSEVAALTNKLLTKVKAKTITNDNGSEFFDVSSVKVPVYFCDVLKPGQRGTVENTIGLLRRFIKKDTDLSEVSDQQLKALEKQINLRPRKCLDYKTPFEVFYNQKVALAV